MDTIYSFLPVSTKAGRDQAHFDPKSVERKLRKKLDDWRTLLRRHIPQVRQMVKSGSRRSHSHPLKRAAKGITNSEHRLHSAEFSLDWRVQIWWRPQAVPSACGHGNRMEKCALPDRQLGLC